MNAPTQDPDFLSAVAVLGQNSLTNLSRKNLIKVMYQLYINSVCSDNARHAVFEENDKLVEENKALRKQKDRKIEELVTITSRLQKINKKMSRLKERIFEMDNYQKQQISEILMTKAAGLNTVLDQVDYAIADMQHSINS